MDVAAVRPDELEPSGDGAPPRADRAGRIVLLLALLLLAALVAVLVSLLLRASDRGDRDDARTAAAAAARAEALNLTTISYQTADADLARILAGSTGTLRSQFAEQRPHFADNLARDKSVSKGDVLAVGVVDSSPTKAQVVVATDATVTTTSAAGKDQSVLKHYRMVLRLVKVSGHWLVSDVAFAGAPQ